MPFRPAARVSHHGRADAADPQRELRQYTQYEDSPGECFQKATQERRESAGLVLPAGRLFDLVEVEVS